MKRDYLTLAVMLILTVSCGFLNAAEDPRARVSFSFTSVPETVTAGDPFTVAVRYKTNLPETNRRFVVGLRFKESPDGFGFGEMILDNEGAGYDTTEGTLLYHVPAGSVTQGNVYLEAFLAPFGMNGEVVEMLESYPRDGTHRYRWEAGSNGHTRDLFYLDRLLMRGEKDQSTYCCGITFEVFLRTFQKFNESSNQKMIGNLSFSGMKRARWEWYGSLGDRVRQMVAVMKNEGIGVEIVDQEKARAGDFCMFWRHNGTGHSVIFIDWIRDATGKIDGMKYWSAQKKTNGIGYRQENFGPPSGLDRNKTFIGRLKRPRGPKDWEDQFASEKYPQPLVVK